MREQYFEHKGRKYTATSAGYILYGLIKVPDPRVIKNRSIDDDNVIDLDDYRLKK